jgi:hypothetical protein
MAESASTPIATASSVAAPVTENPANADTAEVVEVDNESNDQDSSYGDDVYVFFHFKHHS